MPVRSKWICRAPTAQEHGNASLVSKLSRYTYPNNLSPYPHKPPTNQPSHTVLGSLSKSLATIATQPLIVAKVGLQSRPPPARAGKPFKSFGEVLAYIVEHEGPGALFKGIGPQLVKGLLVQGLLMMTKERYVLMFLFSLFSATRAHMGLCLGG